MALLTTMLLLPPSPQSPDMETTIAVLRYQGRPCFAVLPLRVIHTTCSRRERVTLPIHSLLISNSAVLSFSVSLSLSLVANVIIRLWPEQCRGCSLLDIMEAGRNKCIMLLPPAWFYFGPAAWCNECILYSPIFGGLPQAQRGKRNVRGVKFLSRKSSRSRFQFHQR